MDDLQAADPLRTSQTMLERMRGGDPGAWPWFLDRYHGFVADVLTRLVRPAERAERATAEFWGYAYLHDPIQNADSTRRFRSYLVGILRNYALTWDRRERAGKVQAADAVPEAESVDQLSEDAEDTLWANRVLSLSLDRLRERSPRHAQALCWFFGLQQADDPPLKLKGSEIGKRLGLAANAVHQLLHRARESLRALIAEELLETVDPGDFARELDRLVMSLHRAAPDLLTR